MSLDKYVATLMGCAVGDTLGMCVESWKPEQIRKYVGRVTEPMDPVLVKDSSGNLVHEDEFGKLKYWNYKEGARKGDLTDDTILTLALADAIIESQGIDLDVVARHFVKAIDDKQSGKEFKGGFGRATMAAYHNLKKGVSPYESGFKEANGNGPVMKTSPIGLYHNSLRDREEYLIRKCVYAALDVARITHNSPAAVAAAGVQSYAIYTLIRSPTLPVEKDYFMHSLAQLSYEIEEKITGKDPYDDKNSLSSKILWVFNEMPNATEEKAYKVLGNSGLAIESYPFALFMFQKYLDDPLKGLLETVNWGGDCDTTGAIYGALMGAYHGKFWPTEWEPPRDKERIKNTAKLMYELKP